MTRRDLGPIARRDRFLLDDGRDRQHVIRREVLAARVREVDRVPLRIELLELLLHELRRRRLAIEVVRVREQEALEREPLATEARDRPLVGGRRQVAALRELHLAVSLTSGDLGDRAGPRRHLRTRESLGEDDPELPQLADGRRRRRCLPRAVDRERRRGASSQEQHERDQRDDAADDDPPPRRARGCQPAVGLHRSSQPERRCAAARASSGAVPAVLSARSVVNRSS